MDESTNWQVENLRITLFPENNASISPSKLWDEIIAKDPDDVQIHSGRLNARHVEFENGVIFLVKQQEHIEWRYMAKPDEKPDRLKLPTIGSLDCEIDIFLEFSNRWLKSLNLLRANRLAFGAVLLLPAQSLDEGFENLQVFVPQMNLKKVDDLEYRVNRRRKSKVIEDLEINRISQWNVARLERVDPLDPAMFLDDSSSNKAFASRLELDINTVQRGGDLQPNGFVDLFNELVDLGMELTMKGDIP